MTHIFVTAVTQPMTLLGGTVALRMAVVVSTHPLALSGRKHDDDVIST